MARSAICVPTISGIALSIAAASIAAAEITYTNDSRFVQAQNSFGQNVVHQPSPAFSIFQETSPTSTNMPSGTCQSSASQDSSLAPSQMSGSAALSASASATLASGLFFAASGTSSFNVKFKLTAAATVNLSGTLSGKAGKSSYSAKIVEGATTLYSTSASGSFDHDAPLDANVEYTLTVLASCNAFASFTGSPVSDSGNASFTFLAKLKAVCPGDLNNDGVVDDADFSIFAVAYDILDCADPAMPSGCPADLNGDGIVDDADFSIFVVAYDALLCP